MVLNPVEIFGVLLILLLIHPYLTYPLSLWLLTRLPLSAKLQSTRSSLPPLPKDSPPTVSVLIAAFNEEAFIERTVRSLIASHYPRNKLEILVGSDGSTDRTNTILTHLAEEFPNVRPVFFDLRQGKPAVLNALAEQCRGEILIFLDADTTVHPDTIRKLVTLLAPSPVGCVDATIQIRERHHLEQKYYDFDHRIKQLESLLGIVPSLHGLCYGIKKELFTPFPATTMIADDLYRALDILAQRKLIVHASDAYVVELAPRNLKAEVRRRIRYAAGGLQALRLFLQKKVSLPFFAWYAFLSHKFLRWIHLGLFLLLLGVAGSLAPASALYATIFNLQLLLLGIAIIGALGYFLLRIHIPGCYHLFYFFAMSAGLFIGVFHAIRPQSPFWHPPQRQS